MPDTYAVIGNPIAHSKSPQIHAEFARQTGQDIFYSAILAPLDGFVETLKQFRSQGGKGVNVTIPFKYEAWQYATRRSDRAEHAQAVNTLRFDEGEIFGDNTDGAGLVRDIQVNLVCPIEGKRILLMGAGGASSGVLSSLLVEKPISVTIANRTYEKARVLAERFTNLGVVKASGYSELTGKRYDIVINATSASLKNELPPLPRGIFSDDALAYDMMYGQKPTAFLRYAKNNAVSRIADGLGMLVEQAAESFYLWRGVWPKTSPVIALLKQAK